MYYLGFLDSISSYLISHESTFPFDAEDILFHIGPFDSPISAAYYYNVLKEKAKYN